MTETIHGTTIEHQGDVNSALKWFRNNWEDPHVIAIFEDAKTSRDYVREFTVKDVKGFYFLKCINPNAHIYSLSWKEY